jgi:hypothetical protein
MSHTNPHDWQRVELFGWTGSSIVNRRCESIEEATSSLREFQFAWIDIEGVSSAECVSELETAMSIPPLASDTLIDGVRTDIVIDTGSDTSIGNRALQKALARRRKGETTQLQSVTGQVITADIAMARTVKLGTMTMSNSMLVFADTPAFEKLELVKRPALFMGMNQLKLFRRVAIDFSSKRILFDLPDNAEIPFRF